jgi:hypothetical protein
LPSDDNVIGWWVKLTRTGTTNINAQEVFFIVTNAQLESKVDSSFTETNYLNVNSPIPNYYTSYQNVSGILDVPDDVYEHHVTPVEMFRPGVTVAEAAVNKFTRSTDVVGYGPLQNTGGSPFTTAIWTSALDYRYDDKGGLLVDVMTAVTSAGGDVKYKLYARYEDCFHSESAASANRFYLGEVSVDNTAAITAAHAKYLLHRFVVPPGALWDQDAHSVDFYDNPNYTSGKNKGVVRFELVRSDTQAYNAIVVGAVVQSPHGNKTKLGEVFPLNINEQVAPPSGIGSRSGAPNPVYIPGYTRSGAYRSLDMSIQRFTWNYKSVLDRGTLVAVGAGGASGLMPANVPVGDETFPDDSRAFQEGYFVPYSLVITDVYGTCTAAGSRGGTYIPIRGDRPAGQTTGTTFASSPGVGNISPATGMIFLSLMEIPSASMYEADGWTPASGAAKTPSMIVGDSAYGIQGPTGGAVGQNAILSPGVHNLPLCLYPNNAGVIRWNGSSMSNDGTWVANPSKLPTVYLPADYMSLGPYHPAGFPWQLSATYVNTSFASQDIKIQLTVEVALLHNPVDQHYSMMGGAVSKGRSWWEVPSTYNTRLPRVSDLGIDTTILKQWVSSALNDAASNSQRIGVFFIPANDGRIFGLAGLTGGPYGQDSALGVSVAPITANSYLQPAPDTLRIIMNAADAALTPTITVYGADYQGNMATATVTVAATTTDIPTAIAAPNDGWTRIDGVYTSVAPTHADGFSVGPTTSPSNVFGKLQTGKSWWGVLSINSANGGIVHAKRGGPTVGKVLIMEANTGSPKNQFRRIPVWGRVGATLTHTGDRLSMNAPIGSTSLFKRMANSVTTATDMNSIEFIGITDWAAQEESLYGSPTMFCIYDAVTTQRPPWPVGLAAMFAIFDAADAGLVVNVTGVDNAGATVTLPVTATLWTPAWDGAAPPTWNVSASVFEEIHGIAFATRAPYGEWLVGNFAVPWRDETVATTDTDTGVYIAYGSVLY